MQLELHSQIIRHQTRKIYSLNFKTTHLHTHTRTHTHERAHTLRLSLSLSHMIDIFTFVAFFAIKAFCTTIKACSIEYTTVFITAVLTAGDLAVLSIRLVTSCEFKQHYTIIFSTDPIMLHTCNKQFSPIFNEITYRLFNKVSESGQILDVANTSSKYFIKVQEN